MPYINSSDRQMIPEIKVGHDHERLISNWFDSSYHSTDSNGQKLVRPGMILARDTSTNKFVPYNLAASYGTGSDTAVAVLDEYWDMTQGDEAVTPIYHGKLKEAFCYIYGGAVGTVSAAVKTSLEDIVWV